MGSDELSCGFLEALLDARELRVRAVVTQPDRPCGRHLRLQPCAVRAWILEHSLPLEVLTPPKVNAPEVLEALAALRPDAVVVVAYGQFLGSRLLQLPPRGCVNLHLSLLPALRGAAPIVRAILEGLPETGVTAMRMDRGMDTGDILGRRALAIAPDDTTASLTQRLVALGRDLMLDTLARLREGTVQPIPQDHARATYAPKIQKDEWLLDWSRPAEAVCRTVRAFHPRPGCTTFLPAGPVKGGAQPLQPGPLLKVLRAEVASDIPTRQPPGSVLAMQDCPIIAAGEGTAVRLLEVRTEGRPRTISGQEFVNGYRQRVRVGDRFFPGLTLAVDHCG